MHFNTTIDLGTLIALGVMLFTFHKYHTANLKRFMTLEFRVNQMWQIFRRRFNMEETEYFNGDDN